jgi:hypothetical protein
VPRPDNTFKRDSKVLERVDIDLQGLFPIDAVDGTRMNIKAVDLASAYVKMKLIQNKMAATTQDFIKR